MLTTSEQQELRRIQQVLRKADRGFAWRLTVLQGAQCLAAPVRQVYLLVVAVAAAGPRRLVTLAGRLLRAYVKGAVLMDPIALMALADAAWPGWGSGQVPGPSAGPVPDRPQSGGTDPRLALRERRRRVHACRQADLGENQPANVDVGQCPVCLVRTGSTVYTLRD
jgi:hypothetical protein